MKAVNYILPDEKSPVWKLLVEFNLTFDLEKKITIINKIYDYGFDWLAEDLTEEAYGKPIEFEYVEPLKITWIQKIKNFFK